MADFRDVVLKHLKVNYYGVEEGKRPFTSHNKAVLQILIRAQKKIQKHKKLSEEEIVALLDEEECDWTSYEKSHERFINFLYIQGGIKSDKVYNRLMDVERERLRKSIETRKIVQFSMIEV